MENPRPRRSRWSTRCGSGSTGADAALLTEYRGLNVKALADLRRQLRPAGGDYKVYKNTLVRFAARDAGRRRPRRPAHRPDGHRLRHAATPPRSAKTLRDYARTNQNLVVKGGLLGTKVLDRRRRPGPGRPAATRRAAGPARRRLPGPAHQAGRAAAGPAPQLRLRPQGPHRPEGASRAAAANALARH